MYVYVLALEHGRYYIGKTDAPARCLNEHRAGLGPAWTKVHRPLNFAELIDRCHDSDADKVVKQYMSIYGIENVRGGSYSTLYLSANTKQFVNTEIARTKVSCFMCSETGHRADKCTRLPHRGVTTDMTSCLRCGERYRSTCDNLDHHKNDCSHEFMETMIARAIRANTNDVVPRLVAAIQESVPNYFPDIRLDGINYQCPFCELRFKRQRHALKHVMINCPKSTDRIARLREAVLTM